MKLVVLAGHPSLPHEATREILAGAAVNFSAEPSDDLAPIRVLEQIIGESEWDASNPRAVAAEEVPPSRLARLNSSFKNDFRSELVARSCPVALWFSDLWLEASENAQYIFFYESPRALISRNLPLDKASEEGLRAAIAAWMSWNLEVFRVAASHPDRVLLTNCDVVIREPHLLIDAVNHQLELNLKLSLSNSPQEGDRDGLRDLLSSKLIDRFEDAQALYLELESIAHVYDADALGANVELDAAIAKYQETLNADTERRKLDHQRAQLSTDLREMSESLALATRNSQSFQNETESLSRKVGLLSSENDMLAEQMRRLQSALNAAEAARLEGLRALQSRQPTVLKRRQKVSGTYVDFRSEVDGRNWYYAERDGRWAGPAVVSTLKIPPLFSGRYIVSIDVVGVMSWHILQNMRVFCDQQPVNLSHKPYWLFRRLTGRFSLESDADEFSELRFEFPSVASPSDKGSNDRRNLAIRVRGVGIQSLERLKRPILNWAVKKLTS